MRERPSWWVMMLGQLMLIAADARAQSNVSVSGDLNLALASLKGSTDSGQNFSSTKVDSVASHLRVRGIESLDGGLSAVLFLTVGLRADTGTGTVCGRDCWLMLKGTAGTLKLGRLLTMYDDVSLPWYYIDAGGSHNPAALWANCGKGADAAHGCLDDFVDNAIRYDTPSMGGLTVSVALSAPTNGAGGVGSPPRQLVAGAEYRRNGFDYGIAVLRQADMRAVGTKDQALTASFKLISVVNVGLGFEHVKYAGADGTTLQRNYVGLLLSKVIGPHTVWLNHGLAGRGYGSVPMGSAVNAISNAPHSGAAMDSIGYQYKFSRSMQIYTFFNTIRNQSQATYSFDTSASRLQGMGKTLSVLTVGMRKRF
jgi:predicted porin